MSTLSSVGLNPEGAGKKIQTRIVTISGVSYHQQVGVTVPTPATLAQIMVTLTAGVSQQLVAANPARVGLRWMVTGANPMTVAPGTSPAVVGVGMNYSPPASVGQQGGSETMEGTAMTTDAYQAISAAGTVVCVWEMN